MYGLWLFKEIETEYGYCKVEIYRRGYNGSQIEIGALSADSLNVSLENLSTITDPIGKSVCSFSIIDTEQIAYDDFFTPDATAYKVVVSTKVGEGAYVTRWSGYVTPDFFAENLSYRTPISISARDNIGYLNDVDFDLPDSTITVRELIQSAFTKIATDYPMALEFATQKQTAEGILAIDATISTALLREMSWYEAVETVLHDLGLQMRWVDNNTIAVIDLSQIPEYYATQGFNFIDGSGYREILPAWRQLSQEQNYGAFDNFYRGQIDGADKLEYAANSEISANVLLYQPAAKTQWVREGAIYFLNLFNSYNQHIDDNKAESIYVTGIAPTATNAEVLATKMVYSQEVTQVNKQIEIKFNLNDTLRTPLSSLYTRGEYNVFYLPYSTQTGGASGGVSQIKTPRPYQLKYRFNIFLRCNDGSNYVMREDWVDADTVNTEQPFIEFTTEKLKTANTNISDAQGNKKFAYTGYNNDEEYSITINSVPKAGTLEFVVYPWTFEEDSYTRDANAYQRGAKISDIQFAVKLNTTGIISGTLVGATHNIKNTIDYQFGEVPKFDGDLIAYAGGLFYGDTLTAINGFQRNADSTNYNLLELVGREVIHFNKKNYNKLSGTIKNLDKEPLMFNRLFVREGKTYAPFAYSLNVISNEMNITTMQEVEPYETASFTQIDSEVTTGGTTVGGGNNTVLQYSEDAGNAKRIYELNAATEQEKKDGYLIIDNANYPEAKKVHISEVLSDLGLSLVEQDGVTYLKSENSFFTEKDIFSGGLGEEGASGGIIQQVYGASAFGGTFDANNLTDTFNAYAINSLYSTIQRGVKNPYALTINGTPYDGSSAVDITISGGGGGVSGDYLPLSGGTIISTRDIPLALNRTQDGTNALAFQTNGTSKTYVGYSTTNNYGSVLYSYSSYYFLGIKDNGTPHYSFVDGTSYTLIHSGNIGSYNAGSASKLQTGRYLWGNYFDGTYGIAANITLDESSRYIYKTVNSSAIEMLRFPTSSDATYIINRYGIDNKHNVVVGGNLGVCSKTWGTMDFAVSNGNVLIGTTTDWGYRLGVKGAMFIAPNGDHGILIGAQNNTIDGWRVNGNSTDLCLNWQSTGAISVGHGGGNVLIGSAYNSNAKLKVGINRTDNGWLWTSGNLGSYSDFTIEQDDKYGLYTRIERGAGDFGMQVGRSDGNALNYNLLLQPVGGNVIIGATTDNGAKLQVDGNLTFTGDIAAGSDARYKSKLQEMAIDIATIANAPLFSYKWNDREDNNVHLGTTAQYWLNTNFKDAVNINNPDFYHLNYGALGVAIGISVAKKVVNHEERIAVLEKENMQLKQQLNEYRRLS